MDKIWAKDVKEGTFEESTNIDERPFWLILNYVKNLGTEGCADLRARPDFPIRRLGRLAKDLVRRPDEHRFRLGKAAQVVEIAVVAVTVVRVAVARHFRRGGDDGNAALHPFHQDFAALRIDGRIDSHAAF